MDRECYALFFFKCSGKGGCGGVLILRISACFINRDIIFLEIT